MREPTLTLPPICGSFRLPGHEGTDLHPDLDQLAPIVPDLNLTSSPCFVRPASAARPN